MRWLPRSRRRPPPCSPVSSLSPVPRAPIGAPALEPALESAHATQSVILDHLAQEQEIVVEAAVLEDGEEAAAAAGGIDHGRGLGGAQRHRLVDDDMEPPLQGAEGLGSVEVVRRRHHDQLDVVEVPPELV
jgi:hypothetical protein